MHTLRIPLGMKGCRKSGRLQPFEEFAQCGELGRTIPQPVRQPGIPPRTDPTKRERACGFGSAECDVPLDFNE